MQIKFCGHQSISTHVGPVYADVHGACKIGAQPTITFCTAMFCFESATQTAEAKGQQCISKEQDPRGSEHPEPYTLPELVQT